MASTYLNNVASLVLSAGIVQLVGFFSTPILARLYLPDDYGVFAKFTAAATLISTIVALSYPIKIVVIEDDREAKALVRFCLRLVITLSSLIGFGTMAFYFCFVECRANETSIVMAFLAVVQGCCLALASVYSFWMVRKKEFKLIARISALQSFTVALVSLILGQFSVPMGLVYALLLGQILSICLFSMRCKKEIGTGVVRFRETARVHLSSLRYIFPTNLLDVVSSQGIYFLIGVLFSENIVGQYRMAYTLLALPTVLIGSAASPVFYQRFTSVVSDPTECRRLIYRHWIVLGIVGLLPYLTCFLFGDRFIPFLLGEKWVEAGAFGAVMSPMFLFMLIHSATSTAFLSLGLERKMPVFGVIAFVHRMVSILFGFYFDSFSLGLILYATFEILHIVAFQAVALRGTRFRFNSR